MQDTVGWGERVGIASRDHLLSDTTESNPVRTSDTFKILLGLDERTTRNKRNGNGEAEKKPQNRRPFLPHSNHSLLFSSYKGSYPSLFFPLWMNNGNITEDFAVSNIRQRLFFFFFFLHLTTTEFRPQIIIPLPFP
ncbi:hypothetical protein MLD38_038622 [Melastoma candidum]|uniref:Uncharacterized protein n=1 Tax=Melastoma candidum TaxID=119954 RepID=A0ACB9L081_9MYRT|nr:hypothetical protein MLD38_038622 [Melastoma candidum]